jgi:RHS repeat-associated protein
MPPRCGKWGGKMNHRLLVPLAVFVSVILSSSPVVASQPPIRVMPGTAVVHSNTFVPGRINRQPVGGPPAGPHAEKKSRTEIVGLRTRTSNTYSIGQLNEADIYPGSINYQDSRGSWRPIDNSLVPSRRKGYAYTNAANRYTVDLPPDLGSGPVRFAVGSDWLEFSLSGSAGKGGVSADTDTFVNALPGVSLSFSARNDAMKETLTLESISAGNSFTYDMRMAAGLRATPNAQGGIDFVNEASQTQFAFLAPYMFDSSKGSNMASHAVSMTLTQNGSGLSVKVVADRTWLSDPSRKWPISIDPTITLTGSDCEILSGAPSSSYCGSTNINIAYDGTFVDRALVNIRPETVLSNVQIVSASLQMYDFYNSSANVAPVGLYQITQAWDGSATWNNAKTGQPWTTAGGSFVAAPAVTTNSVGGTTGWYYWYPTQLVQNWVNGTAADYGMLLKETTETTMNVMQFYSSYYSNSSFWPQLNVTYDPGLGEQTSFNYENQGLSDRMDLRVNTSNGNLLLHAADFSIRGTGLDLKFDRFFNNLANTTWDFGTRWSVSTGWDVWLLPQADGTIRYMAPSGFQTLFTPGPSGTYVSPAGLDATLTNNGSMYTLTFNATLEKYNFTSGGSLTSDLDRNGDAISFAYNGNGWLASITDTQGRVTTFTYANPTYNYLVTQIQDPAGRLYKYAYTGTDLTTYTDPGNAVSYYSYDAGHNLTQIKDPNGNLTNITYDSNWRVASIVRVTNVSLGTGPTTTYTYNTGIGGCAPAPSGDSVAGYTRSTDANSHSTTYCFDPKHLILQKIYPDSGSGQTTYTQDNHVASSTDPMSQTTTNTYNANNNLSQVTLPTLASGHSPANASAGFRTPSTVAGYQYLESSKTDAQGNCEADVYDAAGNLTDTYVGQAGPCDGLTGGSHLSHRYQGDPGVNCGGKAGELCAVTDAAGNTTTYGYDVNGNRTSVTPPSPIGPTSIVLDGLSRWSSVTDGKGQRTSYSFDQLDRVTQILFNGATSCTPSTGNCIAYSYDKDGNTTSTTDNTGTTSYYFDALNRVTTQTLPDSTSNCAGSSPAGITFAYDAVGNLTQYCDAGGAIVYAYDASNRVVSVAEPGGSCGLTPNLCTSFTNNADGERTQITFPGGATLSTSYDSNGNMTSVVGKDKNGSVLTSFSYTFNLANTDTQARQTMTENDAVASNTYTYAYDALNRLTQATVSAGSGTSYTYGYDANGNMKTRTAGALTTSYAYTGGNEICWAYTGSSNAACSAPPSGSTTYTFDANGNEVANSAGAAFTYNPKDQTTGITYGGTTLSPIAYAGIGQSTRTTAGSTAFNNGLSGVQIATAAGNSTYYLRDSLGNLLGERIGNNRYYYLTDSVGTIVAAITGDGLTIGDRYGYDPFGNTTYRSGSVANPWGYASGYTDTTGLIKFGTRYYDPVIARWTQLDPADVPNRYIYAGCDPINSTDPSGAARVIGNCGISTLNYNHWTGRYFVSLTSYFGRMWWVDWMVSLDGWAWWLAFDRGIAFPFRAIWNHSGRVPFYNWAFDAHSAVFSGVVLTPRGFCSFAVWEGW